MSWNMFQDLPWASFSCCYASPTCPVDIKHHQTNAAKHFRSDWVLDHFLLVSCHTPCQSLTSPAITSCRTLPFISGPRKQMKTMSRSYMKISPPIHQKVGAFCQVVRKQAHPSRNFLPEIKRWNHAKIYQNFKVHTCPHSYLRTSHIKSFRRISLFGFQPRHNPHILDTAIMGGNLKAKLEDGCSITKRRSERTLWQQRSRQQKETQAWVMSTWTMKQHLENVPVDDLQNFSLRWVCMSVNMIIKWSHSKPHESYKH